MIFDLFSKRQKRLRGEIPDIYVYDSLPDPLRVQIVHIIIDALGESKYNSELVENTYKDLHNTLCREYGVFSLSKNYNDSDKKALIEFFLKTTDIEKAIDVIELTFKFIEYIIRDDYNYIYRANVKVKPEEAIEELNGRFKEHAVGYQFIANEIIRVDSTYTHKEIVIPTINLLSNQKFAGANDEYLKAHEHYRHGRNKECLTDCLKAFESTMKIICKEKKWDYKQTDTSSKLIQICFQMELIPTYIQNQFTSLRNLLESGIPTIRNKVGAHGQGQVPTSVDDQITRYGLNLTGSNIIFLIEQSGIK